MTYTYSWDETKPSGSRALNLGDDDIREFKSAIRERLQGGGMYFPSSHDESAGLFNWVKFIEQSANPTQEANRAFFFTKDVGGITEFYWMDSAGTVTQLTSAGKVLLTTLGGYAARGDMIRGGASGWEKKALGASGKVWKSDGTDADWGDLSFQTEASQAEMEAATESTKVVTPRRVQYHPGVAKAWGWFDGTAGTPAMGSGSHNMDSSITDSGTGRFVVSMTTDCADANYAAIGSCVRTAGGQQPNTFAAYGRGVGSFSISTQIPSTDNAGDADLICFAVYGDQ